MRLDDGRTEFFPGRSGESGKTLCRGWELPYGTGLMLPLRLTSVEPGQDRHSSRVQLWRDADGDLWLISYLEAPHEWHGQFIGRNLARAQAELTTLRSH